MTKQVHATPPQAALEVARQALVADDDDDMRTLLAASLRRVGFQVIEASDGEQLVDLFSALWSDDPSQRLVIVSDIGMPVRDGLEATRIMKATAPRVPVILVTAFSDVATLQAARDAGATHVILKPVDRAAFVQAALQSLDSGKPCE